MSLINIIPVHANPLKYLHGLPTKKTVTHAVNFGKSTLTEEAFHLVCIPNHLTIC